MKNQDLLLLAAGGAVAYGAYKIHERFIGLTGEVNALQETIHTITETPGEVLDEIIAGGGNLIEGITGGSGIYFTNEWGPGWGYMNSGVLSGEVGGFTLSDWQAAISRGIIPLTPDQLTQRWISAAQQANVADAISILFSGQTVDIEIVLAAMQGSNNPPGESWEETLERVWVPVEYLAQHYGESPYGLPGGVPLSYLYSGTQAANVLLMEALIGAWSGQSQPWIIQHISDVRGF